VSDTSDKLNEADRLFAENTRLLAKGEELKAQGKWGELTLLIQTIRDNRLTTERLIAEARGEIEDINLAVAEIDLENAKMEQALVRKRKEIETLERETARIRKEIAEAEVVTGLPSLATKTNKKPS